MTLEKILKFMFTPWGVVAVTVIVSGLAWLTPDFSGLGRGFVAGDSLNGASVAGVMIWYGMIIVSTAVGWSFSAIITGSQGRIAALRFSQMGYYVLTTLAFIGVCVMYLMFIRMFGLSGIMDLMRDSQANLLKEALYSDYSKGLLSLRYIAILSGSLALFRITLRRRISVLDIVNLGLLFATALVASRLSLIAAVFIAGFLINRADPGLRRSRFIMVLGMAVVFGLLTLFNAVRNFKTYEKAGVDSPVLANLNEIQRYLGSPFQGSLVGSMSLFDSAQATGSIFESTGIDESLTTNSALLSMVDRYGYLALPIMLATCFTASFIMRSILVYQWSYLLLVYGSLLYCFAEIWRGNLFTAGIAITLVIAGFCAFFADAVWGKASAPLVDLLIIQPGNNRIARTQTPKALKANRSPVVLP